MVKRIGVVVLWLLATLGTASITYAAVSQVGGAVGDDPAVPVAAAEIAARVSTTTTAPVSSTISEGVTTTTGPTPIVTTTTMSTTGSTTAVPATTTTASHTEWKTVAGVGVVGVAVFGSSVSFVSASPVDHYHAEVEDNGPERVKVKFESESFEHTVTAEVKDGVLEWRVESSSESDDSGD